MYLNKMTIWKYVGCNLRDVPKGLLSDTKMSAQQIKELLNDVPLIEGQLEALTVDALTSLLIHDNIFPLKIHPLDHNESKLDRLKRLRANIKIKKP